MRRIKVFFHFYPNHDQNRNVVLTSSTALLLLSLSTANFTFFLPRKQGKKKKNIIKSEVRKQFVSSRKNIITSETRGKLLIPHNENNNHVCKQLHSSFNKNFCSVYLNSLVMAQSIIKLLKIVCDEVLFVKNMCIAHLELH